MSTAVRPLLWKLRDAPIHLLGTFHLGPPGGFSLGSTFTHAFTEAKSLVCEVGPSNKAFDPAILQRQSGSLEADLGSEIYARLKADSRYDASFEAIRPAAIILNLAVGLYSGIGLSPENGVDAALEQQALATGKSCGGFETSTDQLSAILNIDNVAVTGAFNNMIPQSALMLTMRDLIIRSFVGGDESGIQTARELMARWSTSLATKLLSEREDRWMPRLLTIATGDVPTLIAVGALHVVGAGGLVSRLAASGFSADRVD